MISEHLLAVRRLGKTFTLHTQNGATIPVLEDAALDLHAGECVVLTGPSGAGKSTLLRSLFANYKPTAGSIRIRHCGEWVELVGATPQLVMDIRRHTLGYVSQFLRVIPRISARDVVAGSLLDAGGIDVDAARAEAEVMLGRLNLPARLWGLPPATFSGGEQQRVNIARCFVRPYPLLLLDEPTASLDVANRDVVVDLIEQAKARGTAVVGIFHDEMVRARVATRELDVTGFTPAAAVA